MLAYAGKQLWQVIYTTPSYLNSDHAAFATSWLGFENSNEEVN